MPPSERTEIGLPRRIERAQPYRPRAGSDRLHVSQPALSKRIRRMESRIGGPLLVRGYRDVRLTEAGRLLANRTI